MKSFFKHPIFTMLVVFVMLFGIGLVGPLTAQAATLPPLGTASSFAVLAGAAVSDTAVSSTIIGNVGLSPTGGTGITVLSCTDVTGTIYDTNAGYTGGHDSNTACLVTDPGLLITAKADLSTAYNNAKLQVPAITVNASTTDSFAGVGYTLPPGIYNSPSSMGVPISLTLDGGGDPNAVFIFQAGSTLNTVAGSIITLTGGAKASNVFWQVGTSATLGTTSQFEGTIMAAVSITDTGGSIINGRLLADADNTDADSTGAVVLNDTTITVPTSLTLNKVVINDNGGTALVTDWTLSTVAPSPTIISGVAGSAAVTGAEVAPGVYTLSESGGPAGYLASTYSCVLNGGAPVSGNTITLAAGDTATCTITNNDIAPRLHLLKVIVGGSATLADFTLTADGTGANDISGTSPVNSGAGLLADTWALSETTVADYTASAWVCVGGTQVGSNITLGIDEEATCTITNTYAASSDGGYTVVPLVPPLIDVVKVPSPLSLPSGPGAVTYTYTVKNLGTVAMNTVTVVDDTCSNLTLVSGDTNSDSMLDVSETWIYTCSTTLAETHTNTVVATGWANGISSTDIASATVVVGSSIVPPLINITKVPSSFTLSANGGMVTYTKTVTNPGTVPLSNVTVTDANCSPVTYISGDTNGDSKLDPSETWTYRCSMNLTQTTTNTAVASGQANGITARDFALVTVVVPAPVVPVAPTPAPPVPALPDTGFAPQNLGLVILSFIIMIASIFLMVTLRRRTN